MTLIEARDVSKVYKGESEVKALDKVTFQVNEGEFVAIMGPSGSGKSTLLSILGVLNPPTSGELIIDEIKVFELSNEKQADFRREYLGFVFQQFQLIPYLTALENVMLPLAVSKMSKQKKRAAAESVLEKVGLGNKFHRLPHQLSGGEQGRVAVARAIVNEPLIILADEPTGSLDTKTGLEIIELFRELNKAGHTILMVTHNTENLQHVNRTIFIRDGRIDNN
ncbi:MAG: putative transport system ATP-binding protein [Clostridia bacterium]|jgi:putative ABC transport system ATP-binding protein|nr:putative transport system ATP-binding protein [Clostridia bacterium]MDN5322228.1 putative transport system ATP-binding protein [Clostridia bacterium]